MSGPPPIPRSHLALAASGVVMVFFGAATLVAALVPGLHSGTGGFAVAAGIGCLVGVAAWLGVPRLAVPATPRRPPRLALPPETERLAQRLDFDRLLERRLATAHDEEALAAVTREALAALPPTATRQLLLVEPGPAPGGSRAGSGSGCPVGDLAGCAALVAGRTLRFDDPATPDSCPHLIRRTQVPAAALCVPVGPPGAVVAVLHCAASAPYHRPLIEVGYLESVATKVAVRASSLRNRQTPDPAGP